MLVNIDSNWSLRDALALPAGRAAAEDRPLAAGDRPAPSRRRQSYRLRRCSNHRGLWPLGDAVRKHHWAPPSAGAVHQATPLLAGHGASVEVPAEAQALEVGAQLGIVIGAEAELVREADALAFVAGYTICSDLSVPHPSYYRPSLRYKARDGFLPLGPWILAARHVPDPMRCRCGCTSMAARRSAIPPPACSAAWPG
jgi:5-oxopent-3-ene-1,2,5-tricarboxylate decarboxylase/2-hydroxyhepta-2,4-diene-1,7-dioate isomerase